MRYVEYIGGKKDLFENLKYIITKKNDFLLIIIF